MLTKLGIDWRLFIAQLVNFLILFAVLRIFAWKPLVTALEDRRKRVKKGIDNAIAAEEKLKQVEREREEMLAQVRNESSRIMEQAEQKASTLKDEKLKLARQEIEQQVNEAKEMIKNERNATYAALEHDVAKLVTDATGKIVQNLDEHAHSKLIEEAIGDLEATN